LISGSLQIPNENSRQESIIQERRRNQKGYGEQNDKTEEILEHRKSVRKFLIKRIENAYNRLVIIAKGIEYEAAQALVCTN